ncbi:MAG: ATPase, T2SS/T4P/T4SS family [Deltaproteobacteria bacterium]|nr:ATPase, T2SS/T4P/T4SS family [Deltaproteobacteria bacterium]
MKVKKKLGDMLIKANLLTDELLKQALQDQSRAHLKLGQYLVRKGLVGEYNLVETLSKQLNIDKYNPDQYPFDPSLAQLIPVEYAQKYQIAPIRKKGRLLTIATADPLDINALDTIEMMTNCEVEPSVGTEREINQLISNLYGIQSGLSTALEDLEIDARVEKSNEPDEDIQGVTQDGRFTLKMDRKEINVRVSSIPTIYGENLVLRLLDTSGNVYTLDGLGMIASDITKIRSIINKPYGMILSTGPTGSGKSTSIYAILNELNRPDSNIMTLEDPVEYRIDNIRQVQLNRKAGMTFASGLRTILRQDPDIIMLGEIRDPETAAVAVQAAQTGHRLLSTVHTNDAAGAISRFIDMNVEPFLISSVLLASFAQRLVRTICPYCKEDYQPPKEALTAVGLDGAEDAKFQRGKGCNQCMNTGYKGRTGIFEVLINDEMIQHMILERRPAQEITWEAKKSGRLRTLQEDAASKVLLGITTLEEAATAVMM